MITFIGNVIPRAIGKYRLGLAFGAMVFMAAGTAMYEALAPSMANSNWFPTPSVIREDIKRHWLEHFL